VSRDGTVKLGKVPGKRVRGREDKTTTQKGGSGWIAGNIRGADGKHTEGGSRLYAEILLHSSSSMSETLTRGDGSEPRIGGARQGVGGTEELQASGNWRRRGFGCGQELERPATVQRWSVAGR